MRMLPALSLLTACGLVLGACSSGPGEPTLTALGDGSHVGFSLQTTPAHHEVSLATRHVCTSGTPITIKDMSLEGPHGLVLTGWGIVRHGAAGGPGLGEGDGDLADAVPGATHRQVAVRCPANGEDQDEVYVSIEGALPRSTALGVDVHYGHGRTAGIQFGMALCAASSCAPAPVQDQ